MPAVDVKYFLHGRYRGREKAPDFVRSPGLVSVPPVARQCGEQPQSGPQFLPPFVVVARAARSVRRNRLPMKSAAASTMRNTISVWTSIQPVSLLGFPAIAWLRTHRRPGRRTRPGRRVRAGGLCAFTAAVFNRPGSKRADDAHHPITLTPPHLHTSTPLHPHPNPSARPPWYTSSAERYASASIHPNWNAAQRTPVHPPPVSRTTTARVLMHIMAYT